MNYTVSVVIPAYNEEENIRGVISDVLKKFPTAEVIVVNDCSTDKTLEMLEGIQLEQVKVISNEENKGHGYTVMRGLREAQGDYILYIDADRQIDLQDIVTGYDVVSGYRVHRNDKPFRKVISFCLKTTNLLRHGRYIRDANCPYKIYRREALMPLLAKVPQTYIVPIACLEVLARRHKLKTKTIPTPHHPYHGVRQGFLQSFNPKMYRFLWSAFKEVVTL